jgi:hypothetical protein
MRSVSLAVMFGGFKMMIKRNGRNNCELFGTCSDPWERNERNTPLGGVTVVRGVDMVPMPPFQSAGGAAGVGLHSTHTARWQS